MLDIVDTAFSYHGELIKIYLYYDTQFSSVIQLQGVTTEFNVTLHYGLWQNSSSCHDLMKKMPCVL